MRVGLLDRPFVPHNLMSKLPEPYSCTIV